MKNAPIDRMPNWLSRTILLGVALVFVLMPLHAFLSTWGGTSVGPLWLWKSWKELLLLGLALLMIGWLSTRPKLLSGLLRDRLVSLLLSYVGLTLLLAGLYVQDNGPAATAAGLAMNLRYFVMAALAYVLVRYGNFEWPRWSTYASRFLIIVGTAVALIGIIQVHLLPLDFLTQFGYDKSTTIAPYTLIDKNAEAPRAFATLSGPNEYGAWLILPLVLSLLAARRSKWFLIASGIMALAIYESSSRSAELGAVIAIVALGLIVYGVGWLKTRRGIIGLSIAGVAGVALLAAAVTIPSVRLEVFHSSPGDSSLIEGSTAKHFEATGRGIERVTNQPLGHGPGYAGPASSYGDQAHISENYYVQIAEEVGLLGLVLWLSIAGIVVVRLYRMRQDELAVALLASFIGLSAIGLWLHVWADDPLSLVWWGLAGGLLGHYASQERENRVS